MSITLIQRRLEEYKCKTSLEEENALKEITQEIILMALSRAGFFRFAEFHGGTALRILYGLSRFSDDLDFALLKVDKHFAWEHYFAVINNELKVYGYDIEWHDRSKAERNIKKVFLKDNSIGTVLSFNYPNMLSMKKIRVKLEVDVNPPKGAESEIKYLDFPLAFSVRVQTLASSFAGKIHALLCREYVKGRDWYDFGWYVSKRTQVNYILLKNALKQTGPWQNNNIKFNKDWLLNELENKIMSLNWHNVASDVHRFLKPQEQQSLEVWGQEFFISRLGKLGEYLLEQ